MVAEQERVLPHEAPAELGVLLGSAAPNRLFPRDPGRMRFSDGAVHLVLLLSGVDLPELEKDLLGRKSCAKAAQKTLSVKSRFRWGLFLEGRAPEKIDENKDASEDIFDHLEDRFK